MKLPVVGNGASLCNQCVALCCRYFAFNIDKPESKREFEDLRWYLLHEDSVIFVEDGDWYIQINRKCKALLPDNRCGIYENRPAICREYTTEACDWHADEYEYDHLFTEPQQLETFAKEYLAKRRKRRALLTRRKRGRTSVTAKSPRRGNVKSKRRVRPLLIRQSA